MCQNNGAAAKCLVFFPCAQMSMHAIAHMGKYGPDTIRESAVKADSGRKSACRTGHSNPCKHCFSAGRSTNWAIPIYCKNKNKTKNMSLLLCSLHCSSWTMHKRRWRSRLNRSDMNVADLSRCRSFKRCCWNMARAAVRLSIKATIPHIFRPMCTSE